MKRHIAIVEDEPAIRENYIAALSQYGYEVSGYGSRPEAERAFQLKLPDLVIIDIGLGDDVEGGFELCRSLRNQSAVLPIMFLTARDNEFDQISGLRLGADDYLTKDINLQHMLARVVALFRRIDAMHQSNGDKPNTLQRGRLVLDIARMSATWQQQSVELTVTEFWMLHSLVKHPGHVKNRHQLMDAANTVLDDNTITSHIKRIRKKFVHIDPEFDAIQTAYGMGYRWKPQET